VRNGKHSHRSALSPVGSAVSARGTPCDAGCWPPRQPRTSPGGARRQRGFVLGPIGLGHSADESQKEADPVVGDVAEGHAAARDGRERHALGYPGCATDDDSDSDEARVLRPLQAAACTYRIAFGPRAGQKVLTVQGAMPRDADFKQPLCADIDGNRAARGRALRRRRPPGAGATVPLHHAPGVCQRMRANQRRRASGAQAQDPLARRHHPLGNVAAGVHAAAGCAGAPAPATLTYDRYMAFNLAG